ncbi:MAG: arylsulfatase regulator [Acidobacteriia bacterium]|nr:arylsulfatase regulator [Terriglobia bacterium]
MALSAEQLRIASRIDRKIGKLLDAGRDDLAIMGDMSDYMPEFNRLMDTSSREEMDALSARFPGFYYYGKILEMVAKQIRSGEIKVPE